MNIFCPKCNSGAYQADDNSKPLDCAKCRSQIEQKTRQKCWEDLVKEAKSDNRGYVLNQLKQKWEVK